jgi:F-type H+-transporting ATPase subunit gamma
MVFARQQSGSAATIERRQLIPIDFTSFRSQQTMCVPLHNLVPEILLEKLLADYVLALLTEAAVESLASENAARFFAMGAAHDNIAKRSDELHHEAREARQAEITEELLDLVTGAEAANYAAAIRRIARTNLATVFTSAR